MSFRGSICRSAAIEASDPLVESCVLGFYREARKGARNRKLGAERGQLGLVPDRFVLTLFSLTPLFSSLKVDEREEVGPLTSGTV